MENKQEMKISDLIEFLEKIKEEFGDIDVMIARAKYHRLDTSDEVRTFNGIKTKKFSDGAITGNQWVNNTRYDYTSDIDIVVHGDRNDPDTFLELS